MFDAGSILLLFPMGKAVPKTPGTCRPLAGWRGRVSAGTGLCPDGFAAARGTLLVWQVGWLLDQKIGILIARLLAL